MYEGEGTVFLDAKLQLFCSRSTRVINEANQIDESCRTETAKRKGFETYINRAWGA